MNSAVNMRSGREALIAEFDRVRNDTERLCAPLASDDYLIQSIVQTSPPKWHIAHVSYRNFFYPDERWAYTGPRLAEDA